MQGISSKAAGSLINRKKFNDGTELENGEFSDGSGLELYATDYRSYDPQIGRFHQIDPIAEMLENWSPYTYANDNPILFNDPLGLAADSTVKPTPPQPPPTPGFDPDNPKVLPTVVVTAAPKKSSGGFWSGVFCLAGVSLLSFVRWAEDPGILLRKI